MTREAFAKLIMDYITKYQRPYDIRDLTTELWKELDEKWKELRSEN
jgi:hypothetical protein